MKLLIDAGNTRIKWAVVKGNDWLHSGVLPLEQAGDLPGLLAAFQGIRQIWVSNVAGENIARLIRDIKAGQLEAHHFIVARDAQCGVKNGYTDAGQLGSDRWAALIAAWHRVHRGCLVVNCGTATTIDTLSGQREFLGGLIVPGVELMQRSLVAATDQLKHGQGKYVALPRNSADAMFSGAIQAICGAIERQYVLMGDHSAPLVLSGGAAELLQPYLDQKLFGVPPRVVDDLVLQGLMLISQEANE